MRPNRCVQLKHLALRHFFADKYTYIFVKEIQRQRMHTIRIVNATSGPLPVNAALVSSYYASDFFFNPDKSP